MPQDDPSDDVRRTDGAHPTVHPSPGFTLTVTAGSALMTHDNCGQRLPFMNPTPARIRWFVETHRCGPVGSAWHHDAEAATAALREAALYSSTDLQDVRERER